MCATMVRIRRVRFPASALISVRSLLVLLYVGRLYIALLKSNMDRYNGTRDVGGKKDILKAIMANVAEHKGRFLKCEKDGKQWTEISAEKALLKTAHAIQYLMRKEKDELEKKEAQRGAPQFQPPKPTTQNPIPILPAIPLPIATPNPSVTPIRPEDLVARNSQQTLELYSQWMLRANELFWEHVGPEVRQWFPHDMIAAVPLNPSSDSTVVTAELSSMVRP
jgi:hypothetical protein